jgi:hypothetical protein
MSTLGQRRAERRPSGGRVGFCPADTVGLWSVAFFLSTMILAFLRG